MAPKQTPSQTIGPFFAYGLTPEQYGYDYKQLAGNPLPEESAERVRIRGQVFDGNGESICDAMLEIWQADSQGRYARPGNPRVANTKFSGFARFSTGTLANDFYEFETIKPGETQLIVIFFFAYSIARLLDMPIIPALEAA
mgnify:CR=1 FL=1